MNFTLRGHYSIGQPQFTTFKHKFNPDNNPFILLIEQGQMVRGKDTEQEIKSPKF
jgi:hypothetical protein